jgi:5-(carboxyamino)imidazole ribonucleotide synthase
MKVESISFSKTLKLIQNKGVQNPFIQEHNIQQPLSNAENLKSLIVDILDSKLKCLSLWKCTEFGYDGNR